MTTDRRLELMPLSKLKGNPKNPKDHDVGLINQSLGRFGYAEAVLLDERTQMLVAGHGRIETLRAMKKDKQPAPAGVLEKDGDWHVLVQRGWKSKNDKEAEAYLVTSNSSVLFGGWNEDALNKILIGLSKQGEEALAGTGYDAADVDRILRSLKDAAAANDKSLSDRFIVPPFSVLDARQGYWQERKKAWLALGIRSELGRGENLLKHSQLTKLKPTKEQIAAAKKKGHNGHLDEAGKKALGRYADFGGGGVLKRGTGYKGQSASTDDSAESFGQGQRAFNTRKDMATGQTGTSIFDPVLCEVVYRWFAPKGGRVLDPFAGGSVRGVLAAKLGLTYLGIELREEQVKANREQGRQILGKHKHCALWEHGDSREVLPALKGSGPGDEAETFDLVFSCPPYGDLEVYSEDPKDLSAMALADFDSAYAEIIRAALGKLKPNRFAVFLVGDYRDERGFYCRLPDKTIAAFEAAGARLYNDAILVTAVGTLALRVSGFFPKARKLGKAHQNLLIFFKGDPEKISEEFGTLEIPPEALKLVQEAESAVEKEDAEVLMPGSLEFEEGD